MYSLTQNETTYNESFQHFAEKQIWNEWIFFTTEILKRHNHVWSVRIMPTTQTNRRFILFYIRGFVKYLLIILFLQVFLIATSVIFVANIFLTFIQSFLYTIFSFYLIIISDHCNSWIKYKNNDHRKVKKTNTSFFTFTTQWYKNMKKKQKH